MKKWPVLSETFPVSRLLLSAFALFTTLLYTGAAWAVCSADYAGLATINEISDKDQFIEIKILSGSIEASIYDQWELDFCSTDGKNNPTVECSFDLSISNADDSGFPWLVLNGNGLGNANVDLAGMDVRLKDSNGDTVDFVRVGNGADDPSGNRQVSDPDCGAAELPYDTQLEVVGGQSGQFAFRTPDGTGDWSMGSGGSDGKGTESTTNDEDGGGPGIGVDSVSVFQGETAEFTVSMDNTGTSAITVEYATRDGTAVAGIDYSAVSGVVTIPAGMSAPIQVPTLNSASTVSKKFFLELSNPRDDENNPFGKLTSQIGVGTILPKALVIYRMEQSAWSGGIDEVLDTSGNNRNATALDGATTGQAGPAIPGNPGTCRYGEFDGTDDQLSDADAGNYLNGLGAVTVMAWVYNGADLAGNNRGIFFTNNPSGQDNRFGLRYDTDGFYGGKQNVIKASISTDDCATGDQCLQVETVGNVMVRDQWQHLAMTWERGKGIKVFIDGVEVGLSSVEGNGGDGLLARVDRLDIGQGAKNARWQGRIDEFRIFGTALSAEKIDQKRLLTFPCSIGPDHIRLTHPGSGLTCSPSDITVTACADADCNTLFSDPVTVDFTSPAQNWSPDPVTFTGTTNVLLQYTSPAAVSLDAAATSPLAASPTRCFTGGAESCEMTFLDSGFIIEVPDHTAAILMAGTIAAVRKDDTSQRCVPGFSNVTRDVAFWSTYSDPDSGTESVTIDTQPIAGSSPGTVNSLDFDADGIAAFDLAYPDVGRVGLNARYEGNETNGDGGLVLAGVTDFIARPDRFVLDVPGNPQALDGNGGVFKTAGEVFDITVSALNADGDLAPNFGQESTPESVRLESSLVAPIGGENPALAGAFSDFGQACDGTNAALGTACGEFSWPEVGIIALTPRLAAASGYLGFEEVVGTRLENVGRFIPARFDLTVTEPGIVEPFCSASTDFAYTGQDLTWQGGFEPIITAEALNTTGVTTRNYTSGDFLKLDAPDLARVAGASDNAAVNSQGNPFPVTATLNAMTFSNLGGGRVQYTFAATDTLVFNKTVDSRVAPFTPDYSIELSRLEDLDGVTALPQTPVNMNPDFNLQMRYGRLSPDNAYGPETTDLIVPFKAVYYTGSEFALNVADSCWAYDTGTDVTLDDSGLSGGSTSVIGQADVLVSGEPPAGSELMLAAPGENNTGDVGVTFAVPFWLQGDYDDDGSFSNPTATATFGVYRGHDRVIYWRER